MLSQAFTCGCTQAKRERWAKKDGIRSENSRSEGTRKISRWQLCSQLGEQRPPKVCCGRTQGLTREGKLTEVGEKVQDYYKEGILIIPMTAHSISCLEEATFGWSRLTKYRRCWGGSTGTEPGAFATEGGGGRGNVVSVIVNTSSCKKWKGYF